MTDHKAQPLSATAFEPAPTAPEPVTAAPAGGDNRVVMMGLVAAGVLLLFVFFVLPNLVSTDDPAAIERSADSTAPAVTVAGQRAPATAAAEGAGRSPFAEAQESALRREAQDVLQALLSLQESLDSRGAARWGQPPYGNALEAAAAGDTAYRERAFGDATAQYQRALDTLLTLEASLPTRIEALHDTVIAAIELGDMLAAPARFTELSEMAPADVRLIALEDRIRALPEVVAALQAAESAEAARDLSGAVAAAQTATQIDPAHRRAQQRLNTLRGALTRQQFTDAMTAGYGALTDANYDRAESQFRTAAKLIPGAPEPASALAEVAQARTQAKLLGLNQSGLQAEQDERWAEAVTTYQEALAIDPLLLFATEGIARATPRAALDERLEAIPKERDRLIDARIMGLAQATVAEATAISAPGPRLQSQIEAAQATLLYASTPVAVALTSDGMTDVTLLRVKRLGTLTRETLSLRPGVYTAVGIRDGFRDVRVQFEVRPGEQNAVEVRCVDAI